MKYAAVGPVAVHLPDNVETNEELQVEFPDWDMELIAAKTGVLQRHIAGPEECSSDLGVAAAEKLFQEAGVDRASIDFLIFCTQTPDYALPTTACLMQDRLDLPRTIGAFDVNLGCSGFVYSLSVADGLIRSGAAGRILLITAETYSKFIHRSDRSLRTVFGDGAAATLIEAADEPSLYGFHFGTDGSGGDTLLMTKGGCRPPHRAIKPRHRHRWPSDLYMDGPTLISFTLTVVPELAERILESARMTRDDIDMYVFHQATYKMLDQLQRRMDLDERRVPIGLANCGNTVSSTIPILIDQLRCDGRLRPEKTSLLVAFGVGWSWAGCVWRETWSGRSQ